MSESETPGSAWKGVPPPLPENHGKPLAPVMPGERVVSMDVIRGIALLGILISNMIFMSQPYGINGLRSELWFSPVDKLADWISVILVEGKFYPIFSILFGLGVSMQMERASARGLDFKEVYLRRLYILMGFGVLHAVLLWDGDVLLAYGLCGLLLLCFRNRASKTLLVWAAGLILAMSLLMLVLSLLIYLLSAHPSFEADMMEDYAEAEENRNEMFGIFVHGSYADAVVYRLGEMFGTAMYTLLYAPVYLGLFLLGMWAGRERIFKEVGKHERLLRGMLIAGGAAGLLANVFGTWMQMAGLTNSNYGLMLMGISIMSVFGPVLAIAYMAGLVLLIHHKPSFSSLYAPFAAVGRMALTNYLAQSLIATTVFYGYGLGLVGDVGRLQTIGISFLIFAAQVAYSFIWLRFFRYGPMEWLWRRLSYGKRQAMDLTG